ncbi:putative amino-acid n-acetyltransferase subunit [Phaeomoniella chlamydospora]|uniref:Putative amino-acid n-acetyltransferase subunit n=1 Tax=Phaeomoniella chlamydospora TaxID=158046 RepID=A0A0G2G2L7_PHACM|nr:putative amino-acid n-acetyltransferase subunit [Phaeomoniella chlamydospora]
MSAPWKAAGLTYNRYLAVASRAVRRSLKEGPRLQAERRGEMDLRFAKWEGEVGAESCTPRAELATGQLIKDEYFTLFEAVGALEIGDAKMDSGYLEPGETMDDEYDILRELLPEEEEDFSSQNYNRPLLHKFATSELQSLLDNALSWLEEADIQAPRRDALKKRLGFRHHLLTALEADAAGPKHRLAADFRTCAILLKGLKETVNLGRPVQDSFSVKLQRRLASSVPPRPIVSLDTEKALKDFERLCHDAADVDQLLATEANGSLLTAMTTFMSRNPQPSVYIRALVQSLVCHGDRAFGEKTLKEFIYSDLDALVMPNDPLLRPNKERYQREDGIMALAQPEVLLDNFVQRVAVVYINMFRTICLNRSRFRRTLCHAVLDFDSIQAEAEDLDTTLRKFTDEEPLVYSMSPNPTFAYPLSSWMYHYKLRQLEQIIQVGFELSVYALDELPMMYWYLSHIATTHLSHLDRISFFVEQHCESNSERPVPAGQSGNPIIEHREKVDKTMKNLDRLFIQVRAADALSRALHQLYTLLNRHSLLPKPSRPYSTDRLRYELRMRPFIPLSIPEPVSFDDYQQEGLLSHVSDVAILDSAALSVADARKGWEEVLSAKWMDENIDSTDSVQSNGTSLEAEWTKDVKDTIRACIATSIAVAALRKRLDQSMTKANAKKSRGAISGKHSNALDGLNVEIPLAGEKGCWHKWWIVPKIS